MSLEALYPDGKEVTVQGRAVTIKKFTLVRFKRAAQLSKPIINAFFGSGILEIVDDSVVVAANWPLRVVDVLAEVGDELVDFIRFAMFMEGEEFNEFIESLDAADGVEIATAVVKVNWDFITARLLPFLNLRVDTVQPGSTQSTPSSPQAIAETQ